MSFVHTLKANNWHGVLDVATMQESGEFSQDDKEFFLTHRLPLYVNVAFLSGLSWIVVGVR